MGSLYLLDVVLVLVRVMVLRGGASPQSVPDITHEPKPEIPDNLEHPDAANQGYRHTDSDGDV